jgi:hypothetical protein
MASLPPIPERPADRPETFAEYQRRRLIIALHRQFADEITGWLKQDPLPLFDPFRLPWLGWQTQAMNSLRYNFARPPRQGSLLPLRYGTDRQTVNLLLAGRADEIDRSA